MPERPDARCGAKASIHEAVLQRVPSAALPTAGSAPGCQLGDGHDNEHRTVWPVAIRGVDLRCVIGWSQLGGAVTVSLERVVCEGEALDQAWLSCEDCGSDATLMHTPADEPCDFCGGRMLVVVVGGAKPPVMAAPAAGARIEFDTSKVALLDPEKAREYTLSAIRGWLDQAEQITPEDILVFAENYAAGGRADNPARVLVDRLAQLAERLNVGKRRFEGASDACEEVEHELLKLARAVDVPAAVSETDPVMLAGAARMWEMGWRNERGQVEELRAYVETANAELERVGRVLAERALTIAALRRENEDPTGDVAGDLDQARDRLKSAAAEPVPLMPTRDDIRAGIEAELPEDIDAHSAFVSPLLDMMAEGMAKNYATLHQMLGVASDYEARIRKGQVWRLAEGGGRVVRIVGEFNDGSDIGTWCPSGMWPVMDEDGDAGGVTPEYLRCCADLIEDAPSRAAGELWVVTDGRPSGGGLTQHDREILVRRLRDTGERSPDPLIARDALKAADAIEASVGLVVEVEDSLGRGVGVLAGIDWERHPGSDSLWRLGPFLSVYRAADQIEETPAPDESPIGLVPFRPVHNHREDEESRSWCPACMWEAHVAERGNPYDVLVSQRRVIERLRADLDAARGGRKPPPEAASPSRARVREAQEKAVIAALEREQQLETRMSPLRERRARRLVDEVLDRCMEELPARTADVVSETIAEALGDTAGPSRESDAATAAVLSLLWERGLLVSPEDDGSAGFRTRATLRVVEERLREVHHHTEQDRMCPDCLARVMESLTLIRDTLDNTNPFVGGGS